MAKRSDEYLEHARAARVVYKLIQEYLQPNRLRQEDPLEPALREIQRKMAVSAKYADLEDRRQRVRTENEDFRMAKR